MGSIEGNYGSGRGRIGTPAVEGQGGSILGTGPRVRVPQKEGDGGVDTINYSRARIGDEKARGLVIFQNES